MPTVFIERRLDLKNGEVVSVRFHRPMPDGDDYHCDVEILWPNYRRHLRLFGIDGVQAMLLAMQGAHIELLTSTEYIAGNLTWLGEHHFNLPLKGPRTPW